MASSNNSVQQQQQQQQHYPATNPHHCKECGLCFNSAESLEVHLRYHKENLLNKWATQAATSHSEETNNNNPKREFLPNNTIAAADSSDSMKKSPEYSRTTPETIFGHPPTPQSYQSASSPYQQNHDSAFSPNFQNFPMKPERTNSPNYQNNYPNFPEQQFFQIENQHQQYNDFQMHKTNNSYRYHPYQQYERPQSNSQVTSSSPAYPPQPTPSPSPKQCDKCGFVCDSATQLVEHQNMAHPPTPMTTYHPNLFFNNDQQIKEEDAQSEILDLDSHKVHQVYPEEEKRQNGELPTNPHSVSALLNNTWSSPPQKMYQPQYINGPQVQQEKMFMHNQEFMGNTVTTTSQDMSTQNYRPFEHLPSQGTTPVISSTQVPTNPPQTSASPATKSANWKSNEARRPKTYNCTACNKWFTSSGHLKRHYNTTLHKNAVKSSGQPDPASMPISAHHHPARESSQSKEEQNQSNSEEDTNSIPMGGMLCNNVSPPNGEAGPSPNTSIDSRGLLPPPPPPPHGFHQMGHHMMPPIEHNPQFQMYPNGSAPHVTQVTDTTNSLNITGEFGHQDNTTAVVGVSSQETQPLPSFAQFQRYGGLLTGYANVGGGGPVTAPYCYYPDPFETTETRTLMYKTEEDEYRLTVLTVADPAPGHDELGCTISKAGDLLPYSPQAPDPPHTLPSPPSPEKAHIKRDYEESTGSPQITSTTVQAISRPGMYKCIDCDKTFNKACYLTQHNKTFHSGDKPFKCGRCGKRFSNEETHEEHASKHAGDKPHKCDRCPKQFNHKTDLRRHMCLHTGQKPFVCDTCGKGFIRKDHMLKHCETHFRKTQGKLGK